MERLSEVFRRDHERCEQALGETERRAAAGEWPAARAAFAVFRAGIERHMAAEEQHLFPACEAAGAAAESALVASLRKGHRDLRLFFEELDEAIEARDAAEAARIAATTRALLHLHDEKEESALYPAAEARLGDRGAAATALLAGR